MRWMYLTKVIMTSEEIILSHINKFNQNWFKAKKQEFEFSPFYDDGFLVSELTYFQDIITQVYFDENGEKIMDSEYLERFDGQFDINMIDFMISSSEYYYSIGRLFEHSNDLDEETVEKIQTSNRYYVSDIKGLSSKLAKDLFDFSDKYITKDVNKTFYLNAKKSVEIEIGKIEDEDLKEMSGYYLEYFSRAFDILFKEKLEYEKFLKSDETLNFKLNLEDFSALFALINSAGFMESDTSFLEFATKYFKVLDKNNTIINIDFDDLRDRFKKQTNRTHRIKALEKIMLILEEKCEEILNQKK
jgi:hypothetical protein